MKKNIVMIGMPGSGKSTIGRMVAKQLNMKAVDSDRIIEEREGMRLQEIIRTKGNDYFKKIEEDILCDLNCEGYVISPGGSVCYYPEVMEHLSEIADIVYLKVSCEELKKRIHNMQSRGIVFKPGQTFDDLYKERTPLYEKYAGFTVDSSLTEPKQTTQLVLQQLLR